MAQGYYTLEEAAKVLGMSPEKLNKMAQDPRWLKDQKSDGKAISTPFGR